jgi:hypothetical protein
VQSEYERQYQEMVDYREKMAAFYGLVLTEAGDVASLTTEAEAAAATIPASDHLHPVTSDVFRSCASAFGFAGAVTDFGDTLQQAFDRHASEMDVPTGRPVLDGAPSLHQGVEAADTLDSYLNEAQSWLDYCGSAGAFADGVVTGSGADHCLQTADAKSEALQHARDLGVEVREHHEVMLRYENGSITLSKALELGTPSLVAGAAAADAYRRAEDAADQLLKTCH